MKTIFAIILLFVLVSSSYAGDVVSIARSQLGQGEIGGDNRGSIVKKYTKGKEVAWCSGFVSWVVNKAGKNDNYFLSARSWLKAKGSKRTSSPRPGDIIVFSRGNRTGHVGIVETVHGKSITTIEGNVGRYPARVKRCTYTIGRIRNLIGFVRL